MGIRNTYHDPTGVNPPSIFTVENYRMRKKPFGGDPIHENKPGVISLTRRQEPICNIKGKVVDNVHECSFSDDISDKL